MQKNEKEGIKINQPKTQAEREQVAATCSAKLALTMPCVVDGIDNKVGIAYSGWPDRLYIVDRAGKIAYKGGPGPGGFKVDEMGEKLAKVISQSK